MPTNKKRVNLALSEDVYERLKKFKDKNGISSDAGACVMLIVQQLDAIQESEKMMEMVSRFSMDDLKKISEVGLSALVSAAQSENGSKP